MTYRLLFTLRYGKIRTMETQVKHTKKITAVLVAVILLLVAFSCLFLSGCSYKIKYDYMEYENGEGYYVVYAGGNITSLKGELKIPSTYGDGDKKAPVREIAVEGFRGAGITRLVIPASVTKIGVASFANCNRLKEVVFEEGSSLKEIPQGMFGFDVSLTEITLPQSVETIGYRAFYDCEALESVTLPENLKTIMGSVFEDCHRLENITLPEGLEVIGSLAFYNCGLKEIVIPDSVQELYYGVFHTCRSLKKAVVGGGIAVIRSGVFGYCTGLEEIYIPSSVRKIEGMYDGDGDSLLGHAFHNCNTLKIINYAGSQEEWEKINIDNESYSSGGATFNNNALFESKNDKLTINYDKSYDE